jgi:SAM-dependent methyltransferase
MIASFFEFSIPTRLHDLEIMDGEDFSPYEYEKTLEELELINRLTNGYRPTLESIEKLLSANRDTKKRNIRILDIGFGYGDTLRAISRWAKAKNIKVDLVGVDLNPQAREHAQKATSADANIRYITADIFKMPSVAPTAEEKTSAPVSDGGFDIVVNSLFMHHLRDHEIVRVLRWMTENSRLGWVINDLHRHPIAYHFIKHATKLTGFNRLICNDAPLSVARSFRRSDWRGYLAEAGIPESAVTIRWHFPFRYGILCDTHALRNRK